MSITCIIIIIVIIIIIIIIIIIAVTVSELCVWKLDCKLLVVLFVRAPKTEHARTE